MTPLTDAVGVPITWDGCRCDLGSPCNYPPCVMASSVEQYVRFGVYPPGPDGWTVAPAASRARGGAS